MQGDALILRRTYFGDLVLTKENLDDLHERSGGLPFWSAGILQFT